MNKPSMDLSQNHQVVLNICPYLGILSDPETAIGYESSQNFCHHVVPPASPDTTYQRQFCLGDMHIKCEQYAQISKKPLPANFSAADKNHLRKNSFGLKTTMYVLLAVIVFGVCVWGLVRWGPVVVRSVEGFTPTAPVQAIAKSNATFMPTELLFMNSQPSLTQTQIPSKTPMPTRTPTSTPFPPHLLETPFGIARQYLLHRVVTGESLIQLARTYNTSIDAIRAVNLNLQGTLWADTVIIIPFNQLDGTDLMPMIPYEVTESGVTLQELALEHNVDLNKLYEVNNLPSDYRLSAGEWVILPQPTTAP